MICSSSTAAELPALKLERARFIVNQLADPETRTADGIADRLLGDGGPVDKMLSDGGLVDRLLLTVYHQNAANHDTTLQQRTATTTGCSGTTRGTNNCLVDMHFHFRQETTFFWLSRHRIGIDPINHPPYPHPNIQVSENIHNTALVCEWGLL